MLTLYIADVERDVGMKKLSQEEAAKVLEGMKVKIEIPKAAVTQLKRNTALDMAIEALKYSEAPNSSDCISRQAAIDALAEDMPQPYTPDGSHPADEGIFMAQEIYADCIQTLEELPSAEPDHNADHDKKVSFSCNRENDLIGRQAAIDAVEKESQVDGAYGYMDTKSIVDLLNDLPSARPDIKQAAKLLSDFIESCPGGDSYLITPDGEELRTDWGYAMEGIQLIYEWAERGNDG